VREQKKTAARRAPRKPAAAADDAAPAKKGDDARRQEALDLIAETVEALIAERGEDEKVWGSMVKQALKRRKPGFTESFYGFRSFNGLLEEAQRRGALELERDEKSGGYVVRLQTLAE
jgi:hypothetical protein